MEKQAALSELDVNNFLITHWEKIRINYDAESSITYNRMNHIDFKYIIRIRNAYKVKRNVMIRIWLGLLEDEEKMR